VPRSKREKLILPVLPLRGMMLFPYMIAHFDVGREKSIAALEEGFTTDQRVFFVAQNSESSEGTLSQDCSSVGTIARVKQILRMPDDTLRVLAEGMARARIHSVLQEEPYCRAELSPLRSQSRTGQTEIIAFTQCVRHYLEAYAQECGRFPPDTVRSMCEVEDPAQLADVVAANALSRMEDRQRILETEDLGERLEALCTILAREKEVASLEKSVQARVRREIEKHQRDAYLRAQIHAIRKELGEDDDPAANLLRPRLETMPVPPEVREKALREMGRLERAHPESPEAAVIRNYLEWIVDLPWGVHSQAKLDLARARRVLEADHFGLEDVKQRLIEFLAVRKLKGDQKSPILCLVGPPGVGKTSIAQSVARALGRPFVRMSLGGVRDEAEIRGHRRTYIGAIPGGILTQIRQAKAADPVFLLDEIDKLSLSIQGDPAAALLEALDPEQNKTFRDHYLDAPFDLSSVLFITTANTVDSIPRPLLDRMETIELSSYTSFEKRAIARRHLLPKQRAAHGLTGSQLRVTDEALDAIIDRYTREAGVRNLERALARVCRKAACSLLEAEGTAPKALLIKPDSLEPLLGLPKFHTNPVEPAPLCGVVTGLAYTTVGGATLQVECAVLPGTGKLEMTGQLGTVMQESVRAAVSFVRAHAEALGVEKNFYKTRDLHIHVAEGAIPKDGPSAGVTLICAIVSALTGRPVRQDVAMTGEITLRGRVLPIGGVKEKLLAAYRAGIKVVLLPEENLRDVSELPEQAREKLDIRALRTAEDAIAGALLTA
jgi:ATP-dependent Lon protease